MTTFIAHFNYKERTPIAATLKAVDNSLPAISVETDGTSLKYKFNRGCNFIFRDSRSK